MIICINDVQLLKYIIIIIISCILVTNKSHIACILLRFLN